MENVVFSPEVADLFAAHSQFMGAVRDVTADKEGYGYKYAKLSQVLDVARPLLDQFGLSVVQFSSYSGYGPGQVASLPEVKGFVPHLIGDVSVHTVLTHASGQYMRGDLVLPVETKKGLSVAQCIGMTTTYARRYQMAAVLGIAQADEDAAADQQPAGGESQRQNGSARGGAKAAASQGNVALVSDQAVADLQSRIEAIGRDASKFARAVANVSRLNLIPEARLADARAMLEKAEKAAADRAAQASTESSEAVADQAS